MPNQAAFSATTPGAVVKGTVTDKLPILPGTPPTGRTAIGPRITPNFITDAWSSNSSYQYYDVVLVEGTTYIARKAVPTGIEITDTEYWIRWAEPNAQFAELQNTVETFDGRITVAQSTADSAINEINEIKNKYASYVNALNFGVNEENNDNSSEIMDAINYCIEKNYILYIPKGTYKFLTTIKITSPIVIIGAGINNTILKFSNNIDGINVSLPSGELPEQSVQFVMKDLTVSNTDLYWYNPNTITEGNGIYINAQSVYISNVSSQGFYNAFNLNNVKGGTANYNLDNISAMYSYFGIVNRAADVFASSVNSGPNRRCVYNVGGLNISNIHVWGFSETGVFNQGKIYISNLEIESPVILYESTIFVIHNRINGTMKISNAIFWNFPEKTDSNYSQLLYNEQGVIEATNIIVNKPNDTTVCPPIAGCGEGIIMLKNCIIDNVFTSIYNNSIGYTTSKGCIYSDTIAMNSNFTSATGVYKAVLNTVKNISYE